MGRSGLVVQMGQVIFRRVIRVELGLEEVGEGRVRLGRGMGRTL